MSYRARFAAIVAILVKEPRTAAQIADALGAKRHGSTTPNITACLRALEAEGLAREVGTVQTRGPEQRVWEWVEQ